MRVLLQSYGSRGDVEPMVALAVYLRELGVEVRMCLPPDDEFAALLAGTGVELLPFGQSVRELVTGGGGPARAPQVAEGLVNEWFDTVLPAAGGCDALVVSGLMPAGGPAVAETVGMPYVCALLQSRCCPRRSTSRWVGPGSRFRPVPTSRRCGRWTPRRRTTCTPPPSTGGGRRSACRRSATSAITSSPITPGWPATPSWTRRSGRPASTSSRPGRGSGPTAVRCPLI